MVEELEEKLWEKLKNPNQKDCMVLYRLLQIHIRRSESFAKDLKNYLL